MKKPEGLRVSWGAEYESNSKLSRHDHIFMRSWGPFWFSIYHVRAERMK